MPLNCPGDTPRRAMRATVSCRPNPQSINTRVWPTATNSALPSLPLPKDAKRMDISGSLLLIDILVDRLKHLLADRVACAVLIGDGHFARFSAILDIHAIVPGGIFAALPEHQLVKPTSLKLNGTQVVDALFAILVFHRQTRAFDSQPHFAPRPVKRI